MQLYWQVQGRRYVWVFWMFCILLMGGGAVRIGRPAAFSPQMDTLPDRQRHEVTRLVDTAVLPPAILNTKRVLPARPQRAAPNTKLYESSDQQIKTVVRLLPPEPDTLMPQSAMTHQAASPPPAPLENARLIIPSIEVSQPIGIIPIVNGEWDVSELGAGVGHMTSTGVVPGGEWAMTFAGHATIPWPQAGAFANLIRLEHGEEIIYRWNGEDYIYEVTRILIVTPDFVEGLYEPNGNMLMLATCSGWSDTEFDYTKRMITRAELVRVVPSPTSLKMKRIA